MSVLEKILIEIEHEAMTNKDIGRKQCEGMTRAMNIIRSQMDEPTVSISEIVGNDRNTLVAEGWIPVEERLPEEDVTVLVTVNGLYNRLSFSSAIELGDLCSDGSWFIDGYPEWDDPDVTAWMPLPEPYGGSK